MLTSQHLNRSGTIISLWDSSEEILKYEDKDKKRITKGEYGIIYSKEIEELFLKDLQSREPVLRGNADRKSLAIKVDSNLVARVLHEIMPEITDLLQHSGGFKSPHLNGDIDLHISLANMTGNPRHSLKDPFRFKPRWIGVDLDGTLAKKGKYYTGDIGEVLPKMREKLLSHIAKGMEVKIFTARVAQPCDKTGRNPNEIKLFIQDWLEANEMPRLDVTCVKSRESAYSSTTTSAYNVFPMRMPLFKRNTTISIAKRCIIYPSIHKL